MKRIVAAFLAAGAALAPAAADDRVERALGADRFATGGTLEIAAETRGDLVAAAGEMDVGGPVGGDAVLAGGKVSLRAAVGQDLYAAGGRVRVNAGVARNARLAGGYVELGPQARVAGNATIAGGDVRILGAVGGYLQLGAGRVLIDGPVGGDVEAGTGDLELGPNARIEGRLRYASRADLWRHPSAQVRGGVERIAVPEPLSQRTEERAAFGLAVLWTAGLVLAAGVLAAALPGLSAGVAATLRARWGRSILVGFVALVCIPVGAILAAATVIGLPLALVTIALYAVLLLLGYVWAGVSLGQLAFSGPRFAATGWKIGAAAAGMLAISLLARIPHAGWIVILAAMLCGLGALLIQLRRALRP